jgi:hypothetical protein
MPSTEGQCPTCDGRNFVVRNKNQHPCPTCSPATVTIGPYLTANGTEPSTPLQLARSTACGLGAVLIIGALALVAKILWH